MLTRRPDAIRPSEITPESVFHGRRHLLAAAGFAGAGLLLGRGGRAEDIPKDLRRLAGVRKSPLSSTEASNSFEDISHYNNFYEFGLDKSDPADYSAGFRPRPWTVTIDGEAAVKGRFTLEDILKPHPLEERIYRFRCVEAWSMVIPWVGFPLGDLIRRFRPTSQAKYVAFETVLRPAEMPGQRSPVLDWPYVEGLSMAEAMHPLTILAVGVYGVELPNQNGAPLRLVVPWKYGFKGIKSIVRISFTARQPRTTWSTSAPDEYGFLANVNPKVDHPRWSQATERRIGSPLFSPKQPTLPFNGYAAQVASLYTGVDLVRNF
ncbi:MAG: protein-methionine-sulfoxide reductase catalytic subunit MsrP [Gammaproteobacteria bacterium]|nr:protein-methionine-sulfoxide reductase catalytic subunit MsrP [Gammaproteobacteria bacterium]